MLILNKQYEENKNDLLHFSEVKLIYRSKVKASERPLVTQANDAYDILFSYWDKDTIALSEEFNMLMLDRRGRCMGLANISKGSTSGTLVDPKIVFAIALKARAHSLIFCHNHPSGDPKPSNTDIKLTKKFQRGAKLLDIKLHDHLIITPEEGHFFSFADEWLMDDIRDFEF